MLFSTVETALMVTYVEKDGNESRMYDFEHNTYIASGKDDDELFANASLRFPNKLFVKLLNPRIAK